MVRSTGALDNPFQNGQLFADLSDILFRLKDGTFIEPLAETAILFHEDDQRLHHLNSSSAMLASRLASGATVNDLIAELQACGADPQQSLDWVSKFLIEMARICVLTADCRSSQLVAPHCETIRIGRLSIQLEYSSHRLSDLIGPAYTHLAGSPHPAQCRFKIWEKGRFVFISKNGSPAEVVETTFSGVRLKGLVIEEVLRAPDHLAALHAAYLTRADHGVLLVGAPGSGKSTLALTLLEKDFRYGSDDVTLLQSDGSLAGLPLAPSVKEGSWAIVNEMGWTLSDFHLRPDGQSARIARIGRRLLASSHAIRTIMILSRSADEGAELEPIQPAEALAHLMRESRSPTGFCSREIMSKMAKVVKGASSYKLRFCEATDAVPLIQAAMQNG